MYKRKKLKLEYAEELKKLKKECKELQKQKWTLQCDIETLMEDFKKKKQELDDEFEGLE